jgi:hypothetical protein
MPNESLYLAKPSLAFAKLVSTPTDDSWSQVYNAGNLFACVSLTQTPGDESDSLQSLGKDIFNNLEAEFFTLEEKKLATIADAIQKSLHNIPSTVLISLCLAFFKDNILYLFIVGLGKIVIKRNDKIGVLLEKKDEQDKNAILTASGYLQNKDIIVLQTDQFAHDISNEKLASALELILPNDIAEALSPQIHEKDDGGQAAIIVAYQGIAKTFHEEEMIVEEKHEPAYDLPPHENVSEEKHVPKKHIQSIFPFKVPKISFSFFKLTHRKKIFLSIAIILVVLLVASIFLTKKKQEDAHIHQQFQSLYTNAQNSFEEGKALQKLNNNLSREDFMKAEKLLKENANTLKQGSSEQKQLADLLQNVETELAGFSGTTNIAAKETKVDSNTLLDVEKQTGNAIGFTQDVNNVYILTNKKIIVIDKTTGKKKDLLTGDWKKAMSIATYQGNLYVLDQESGVMKYVAGADGYGKSSYFSTAPDLSKANAIAIDSSVYILFTDGTILKFTRGQADTFKVSGLDNPFVEPVKLFTDKQAENLYVLDRGGSRVIQLSKEGIFQKSYPAEIIGQAKDFEVYERDKKILFLSNDKIWEISMK